MSVVIPCFNHGQYLPRTLASLARQSFQDFEVILVDDGSDDPCTVEFLDSLEVSAIQLLRQPNRGPSAARNAGIARARGRYICCLDADDHVAPTYLEKCLVLLEGNYGIRLAYSWVQLEGEERRLHRAAEFDAGLLRYFNFICVAAVFHRTDWQRVGGFDESREAMFEDWDFWISLASHGVRGKVIAEPLLFYRRQAGSRLQQGNQRGVHSYRRLRSRHPRVYSGSLGLRELVAGYFDRWTQVPLLNLSRAAQYKATAPGAVVAVIDSTADLTEWKRRLDGMTASTQIFVIVGDCSELPVWLLERAEAVYWLTNLLHRSQWSDFIRNFAQTRGIGGLRECGFIARHLH